MSAKVSIASKQQSSSEPLSSFSRLDSSYIAKAISEFFTTKASDRYSDAYTRLTACFNTRSEAQFEAMIGEVEKLLGTKRYGPAAIDCLRFMLQQLTTVSCDAGQRLTGQLFSLPVLISGGVAVSDILFPDSFQREARSIIQQHVLISAGAALIILPRLLTFDEVNVLSRQDIAKLRDFLKASDIPGAMDMVETLLAARKSTASGIREVLAVTGQEEAAALFVGFVHSCQVKPFGISSLIDNAITMGDAEPGEDSITDMLVGDMMKTLDYQLAGVSGQLSAVLGVEALTLTDGLAMWSEGMVDLVYQTRRLNLERELAILHGSLSVNVEHMLEVVDCDLDPNRSVAIITLRHPRNDGVVAIECDWPTLHDEDPLASDANLEGMLEELGYSFE